MHRIHPPLARIAALLFALALAACGDGGIGPTPGSVTVSPTSLLMGVGHQEPLTATALDDAGNPMPNARFVWRSSDEAVAEVSADGVVRALAAGEAEIIAESRGRRGTARVTVQGGSTGPADFVWSEWTPRAVDPAVHDSATLVVQTTGAVGSAAIVRGSTTVADLKSAGNGRWTVRMAVPDLVRGYQQGLGHNFVGHLRLNGDAAGGWIVSMNVRDAAMPNVPVQALAADAQASTRVFNLRWDDVYLGRTVPKPVVRRLYEYFPDDYDWVAAVQPVSSPDNRFFVHVRNDVRGIGVNLLDNGADWGSARRLKGTIQFPLDSYFDLAETAAPHEIGHQWMAFLRQESSLQPGVPHWPISTLAYGIMGFTAGGAGAAFRYRLEPLGNGDYRMAQAPQAREFNDMELYLMGLAPASEVGKHVVFINQNQLDQLRPDGVLRGPVREVTAADVIALYGPREPAYPQSQTSFRLATIVLSRGRLLTPPEMAFFDHMAARGEAATELPYETGLLRGVTKPFGPATRGRATLSTKLR